MIINFSLSLSLYIDMPSISLHNIYPTTDIWLKPKRVMGLATQT